MEQVPGKKDHVYIPRFGKTHYFVEGFPRVVAADVVSFIIADMTVCCDEDSDSVGNCGGALVEKIRGSERYIAREERTCEGRHVGLFQLFGPGMYVLGRERQGDMHSNG